MACCNLKWSEKHLCQSHCIHQHCTQFSASILWKVIVAEASSGMWWFVIRYVVPSVLKDHHAFSLYDQSGLSRTVAFTQWHNTTSQKTWALTKTTVRHSSLNYCGIHDWLSNISAMPAVWYIVLHKHTELGKSHVKLITTLWVIMCVNGTLSYEWV